MSSTVHLDYEGSKFLPTDICDTYPAIDPTQWDLSGKVVVISGGSRGIGRAIAVSYAKAGVEGLALLARSASALDEAEAVIRAVAISAKGEDASPKVLKLVVDITDAKAVQDAEAQVRADLGRVDIVVNNAGRLGRYAPIARTDPEDWWNAWEVNVKGMYLVTRAFLPLLQDSEDGLKTIVNVSTNGAIAVLPFGISAYQIGKLAMVRFTEFIAAEYGQKGVLAITMHPGAIKSELSDGLPVECLETVVDTVELAGDTVVWISKERREWLQGRYVDANWNVMELEAKKDEIVSGDKLKLRLAI